MKFSFAGRKSFISIVGFLVLMLVLPATAAFAQDISQQAAFPGSIQQGNWFEQWNQPGTMFCPNNNGRSITTTNEGFTLSATNGEGILSIAYSTSRVNMTLARTGSGNYVATNISNQWVHLVEATRISAQQMSVVSTFYSRDGSCTLSNGAVWSITSGQPQPQPPPSNSCTVTTGSGVSVLNKRSGPGVNFGIVGQLLRGQIATVINVAYDNAGRRWWMLSDNSWVSASYTSSQGPCPN